MPDGTCVFGLVAEDYARYRPGYPAGVLDELRRVCGMTADWTVADVGSGTGNLARLFLEAGHQVAGVEPNREMREAAEGLLAKYPAFCSVNAPAESIPLDPQSIDLITVGQALHWFDADKARAEFLRILRPGGWVAVLWNDRLGDATPFTMEYSAVTNAMADQRPPLQAAISPFHTGLDCIFAGLTPHLVSFPHTQRLDLEGLLGRARSSGFIPQPGEPCHDEFTARMMDLFARHECEGAVEFHYVTRLHCGHL